MREKKRDRYVDIERERKIETERETERQRETERKRETEKDVSLPNTYKIYRYTN